MICGVGTDIVDVQRIRRAGDRWGDRFLKRVFTEKELSYCRTKNDPYPHLAGRFAAKEATLKALSSLWESRFLIRLKDIEILNHPTGRPFVRLKTEGLEPPKDLRIHLSVSHERGLAVATVILEKSPEQPV